jgi:hypothetical protein
MDDILAVITLISSSVDKSGHHVMLSIRIRDQIINQVGFLLGTHDLHLLGTMGSVHGSNGWGKSIQTATGPMDHVLMDIASQHEVNGRLLCTMHDSME